MASSSLDSDTRFPGGKPLKGHDTKSLGPSDNSDSGSDMTGLEGGDDSDSAGTGERQSAGGNAHVKSGNDIGTDRVIEAEEAGLGGGMDQAEEARAGKTDEDVEREAKAGRGKPARP